MSEFSQLMMLIFCVSVVAGTGLALGVICFISWQKMLTAGFRFASSKIKQWW
jgi:hypothetical protein